MFTVGIVSPGEVISETTVWIARPPLVTTSMSLMTPWDPTGTGTFKSISALPVQSGLRAYQPVSPVEKRNPVIELPFPALGTPAAMTKSLRESAGTVEVRNGYSFNRALGAVGIRPISLDCPAIIALESGIATAIVVSSGGHDTQPQQKS